MTKDRPDTFRVQVRSDLAAFASVWPTSGRRSEACCHVFQHADVIACWLATIGAARGTDPHFVAVFDCDDAPVLLLALGIERRLGVRVLGFLDGTVSDYNQPILFPAAGRLCVSAMARVWRTILERLPKVDLVEFDKMPGASGDLDNPLIALGAPRSDVSGHATRLDATAEALEQRLPRRKVRARHLKQLRAIGPVDFRVAETRTEAEAIMDTLFAQKSRQFAETRVPGFEVAGKQAFFAQSLERLCNFEPLHVSALTVGETMVATHWGLVSQDRFYMLLTAYAADDWRRYSPGALLHDHLMRWSQSRGLAWFDFGVGDEAYKDEYCETVIPLHTLTKPVTAAGRSYLAGRSALRRLRTTRAWQAARPLKWRLLRAVRGG